MKSARVACWLAATLLAGGAARAAEIPVIKNVLGPEGPLVIDGNLYYVGWVSSTLSRWDGRSSTVLNSTPGCGHTGLALTQRKTLLIACDDIHGAIIEADLSGRQLRRWDTDSQGRKLDGGINDIVKIPNVE